MLGYRFLLLGREVRARILGNLENLRIRNNDHVILDRLSLLLLPHLELDRLVNDPFLTEFYDSHMQPFNFLLEIVLPGLCSKLLLFNHFLKLLNRLSVVVPLCFQSLNTAVIEEIGPSRFEIAERARTLS